MPISGHGLSSKVLIIAMARENHSQMLSSSLAASLQDTYVRSLSLHHARSRPLLLTLGRWPLCGVSPEHGLEGQSPDMDVMWVTCRRTQMVSDVELLQAEVTMRHTSQHEVGRAAAIE